MLAQGLFLRRVFGTEAAHFSANFATFWPVLNPLYIGPINPQICTVFKVVKNQCKIGRNPPIGGKTLSVAVTSRPETG